MNEKTSIILNSLLYILSKFEGNMVGKHKLFKILYFAEQKHLAKYGKSITGDRYIAMEFGPVPSHAFDIIKSAEGKEVQEDFDNLSEFISVEGYNAIGKISPDLEWLSQSEIECIDESYEENKHLSFGALTDKSHDSAWLEANRIMNVEKIAEAGGATKEMLDYIQCKDELKRIRF